MKKKDFLWSLLAIVMAATMSVGLSSCRDDDDPELSISSPSSLSISLQANGDGDKTITVSASNTDWSADVSYVDGSDWLTLGSPNGSSISFTVTENTTTSPRTAKVKITATANASLNKEVTVTQAGGEASLSVDRTSIDFQMDGGSQTIQVTSNTSWELKGKDGWLTVNPDSKSSAESEIKTVTISASENTTGETRNCTLTFRTTDNKASASVTVTQRGLAGVSAEPSDELLMCYSYAHGVSCGSKTKYFYIALYNQSTYEKMSDREVIADVVTGKVEDREAPSDDIYFSWNLSENSSYVLAIVPYGENDRQGKLYTKQIKTKNSNSEPNVEISNFSIDWDTESYVWNTKKNTYCSSYYTYAVSSK
ncbi:MAG: BACON domain-containing protein, partial [Bacteroidaceae bacterium]|nr:BACON domain-containing protein [Bacteroidaceae bacterium]